MPYLAISLPYQPPESKSGAQKRPHLLVATLVDLRNSRLRSPRRSKVRHLQGVAGSGAAPDPDGPHGNGKCVGAGREGVGPMLAGANP